VQKYENLAAVCIHDRGKREWLARILAEKLLIIKAAF
jgi:hypothetical protein